MVLQPLVVRRSQETNRSYCPVDFPSLSFPRRSNSEESASLNAAANGGAQQNTAARGSLAAFSCAPTRYPVTEVAPAPMPRSQSAAVWSFLLRPSRQAGRVARAAEPHLCPRHLGEWEGGARPNLHVVPYLPTPYLLSAPHGDAAVLAAANWSTLFELPCTPQPAAQGTRARAPWLPFRRGRAGAVWAAGWSWLAVEPGRHRKPRSQRPEVARQVPPISLMRTTSLCPPQGSC